MVFEFPAIKLLYLTTGFLCKVSLQYLCEVIILDVLFYVFPGLKDILVRENENRARETDELRIAMELSNQALGEALERESNDCKQRLSHAKEDLRDEAKSAKKELRDKMDTDANDLKRKIEMETNEIR